MQGNGQSSPNESPTPFNETNEERNVFDAHSPSRFLVDHPKYKENVL